MYSDAVDINFGQQYHTVQLVKEDFACFELLFGFIVRDIPVHHPQESETIVLLWIAEI